MQLTKHTHTYIYTSSYSGSNSSDVYRSRARASNGGQGFGDVGRVDYICVCFTAEIIKATLLAPLSCHRPANSRVCFSFSLEIYRNLQDYQLTIRIFGNFGRTYCDDVSLLKLIKMYVAHITAKGGNPKLALTVDLSILILKILIFNSTINLKLLETLQSNIPPRRTIRRVSYNIQKPILSLSSHNQKPLLFSISRRSSLGQILLSSRRTDNKASNNNCPADSLVLSVSLSSICATI